MIELSILELLYLVLTFFLIIIGTLLTLILLRLLKILAVGVELAEYYEKMKQLFIYYSVVPYVVKDKIFDMFTWEASKPSEEFQENSK